ncbi:MAG: acyl-CoA dehydrogenase family protein [Bryobacteraceae bacterium]
MRHAGLPFSFQTHEVLNQTPSLTGYNLFLRDSILRQTLDLEGAGWSAPAAEAFGWKMGTEEVIRWGFEANENEPRLCTHDRYGNRIDEVDFHPSWHELMRLSVQHGLHCEPWLRPIPGAHVARAALMMMAAQNEEGHLCPVSMTYSAVAALRSEPGVADEWEPRILSREYDPRSQPARDKTGVLIGMAMTEKQGGSDVRSNSTRAEPCGAGEYAVTGHKWFCSAPMCDAFLVLAQAPRGLSCLLLPRWAPDGRRNGFHIQRLKRKLGNRSNASSEVEFDQASARLVGEEGRGVPAIIEMVRHTRLDCVIASAGLMRQAVVQAVHHAYHRTAFGRRLIDQPLMRNVLADLCLESEAATMLAMRLARAFDGGDNMAERGMARLATAAAKYWICKRAIPHVAEALECLGGNGYVEESVMPRLYRETPLNSVWEGAGNVICLDVLRAMAREPDSVECVRKEIRLGYGADQRLDRYIVELEQDLDRCGSAATKGASGSPEVFEMEARRLTERLALALQGSLLVRQSIPAAIDAFLGSRLEGDWGHSAGTLNSVLDLPRIIERAWRE